MTGAWRAGTCFIPISLQSRLRRRPVWTSHAYEYQTGADFWDDWWFRRAKYSDLTFTYMHTWRAIRQGLLVEALCDWAKRVVELTVAVTRFRFAHARRRHRRDVISGWSSLADQSKRTNIDDQSSRTLPATRRGLYDVTSWYSAQRDVIARRRCSSGVKRRCDAVHANAPRRPSITTTNHTNCLCWLLSYRLYPLPEFRRFW